MFDVLVIPEISRIGFPKPLVVSTCSLYEVILLEEERPYLSAQLRVGEHAVVALLAGEAWFGLSTSSNALYAFKRPEP